MLAEVDDADAVERSHGYGLMSVSSSGTRNAMPRLQEVADDISEGLGAIALDVMGCVVHVLQRRVPHEPPIGAPVLGRDHAVELAKEHERPYV